MTDVASRPRTRTAWRPVHGVLLLDKPAGLTSNAALQRVRRLFRAEKAGHTGTLDPMASGLLPVCFGAATKFAQASLEADKRYLATLRLGIATDSGDAEGTVVTRSDPLAARVTRAALRAALERFVGPIAQVPPMHSALKRDGRPLYEYARAGIELPLEPRRVTIHGIDVVGGDDAAPSDLWVLDVHCSKGTYVRALARDLGDALGCGAHLAALRRTASGRLHVDQATTLEALEALDEAGRAARLLPADALVADWPPVRLGADDAERFAHGLRRRTALADLPHVRVYGPGPGDFLGGGRVVAGELIATRLLSPDERGVAATAPA